MVSCFLGRSVLYCMMFRQLKAVVMRSLTRLTGVFWIEREDIARDVSISPDHSDDLWGSTR